MNPLTSLFRSRKFLLALVGVVQTVLFSIIVPYVLPASPIPVETWTVVWQSINALLMVVIAAIGIEDAALKLRASAPAPR